MTDRKPRRPRDPAQLAKLVVDIATGEAEDEAPPELTEAQKFARKGGTKGGRVRADRLTPEERSRIAKRAAESRWRKK